MNSWSAVNWPPGSATAMPADTVSVKSRPSPSHSRSVATASRICSTRLLAPAPSVAGSTSPNSSPPQRPTTSDARLGPLCAGARGYVYYVSLAGVTGAAAADPAIVARQLERVRASCALPLLVGFGIKDPATAVAMAPHANGIVVGSALVEALAGEGDPGVAAERARNFLVPFRAALDGTSPALR